MNFALQTKSSSGAGAPVFCPRISGSGGYAQGILIIIAALAVLYVVVQSSVHVQLSIAAAGGLLGMLAVRNRHSPLVEVDERAAMYRPTFRSDTSQLAVVGNAMLERTRKKNQPLSILVLDFSDLPELQIIYRSQAARDLVPTIERKLQRLAPSKGAVVRTGPTTFTVLLPDFDSRTTLRVLHKSFGKACCLEFALSNNEMLLVPDYVVGTLRSGTETVEDVYKVLCGDILNAQRRADRRQDYLRRERESHTRPMTL